MQALDLEEHVRHQERAAGHSFQPPLRIVDQAREGGEVQRYLVDAPVAQLLDAAGDQKLHQAVRRLMLATHQRERHGRSSVAGREVEKTADTPARVAPDDDEAVAVIVPSQLVEGHREPALGRALPPVAAHTVQFRELGLGQRGKLL